MGIVGWVIVAFIALVLFVVWLEVKAKQEEAERRKEELKAQTERERAQREAEIERAMREQAQRAYEARGQAMRGPVAHARTETIRSPMRPTSGSISGGRFAHTETVQDTHTLYVVQDVVQEPVSWPSSCDDGDRHRSSYSHSSSHDSGSSYSSSDSGSSSSDSGSSSSDSGSSSSDSGSSDSSGGGGSD